jgi:hypothetical protein
VSEKGEGDVEIVPGNDANALGSREHFCLPGDEALDGLLGQDESDEKASPFKALDASALRHARSSRIVSSVGEPVAELFQLLAL